MKPIHILILIVLYMIYKAKQNAAPQADANSRILPLTNEAILRRDMQERYDLLAAEIADMKGSAFA